MPIKERHAVHIAFLRANVTPGCIVMTHFAPSWRSIPEAFKTDRNGYCASMLDDLVDETARRCGSTGICITEPTTGSGRRG